MGKCNLPDFPAQREVPTQLETNNQAELLERQQRVLEQLRAAQRNRNALFLENRQNEQHTEGEEENAQHAATH